MTTATQSAPITEQADRFRCEAEVPDPPGDAAGRKQYWEDTVAEAVAELRRRLASTRDEKSFQALQMIVDLEKTRLRHKAPVAGTEVASRWSPGMGSMADSTFDGGRVPGQDDLTPPAAPATLSVPERVEDEVVGEVAGLTESEMLAPSRRVGLRRNDDLRESETPAPTRRVGLRQNDDAPLNTPSPERGGGRGVGSSADLPAYPFPPKPLNDSE